MMKSICMVLGFIIFLWGLGIEAGEFKFPEIAEWRQSGEVDTFIPKNLYVYINGEADLYLTYDFEELKVAEYQNEKKASVTVDVYRHKTPLLAFGVYSQERLPSANYIDVGAQGYIESNVLNFLNGSYYVKISSYNMGAKDQKILLAFAKKVADHLGEKGTLPPILASFPEEGKVKNSEKFVAKNFLGYVSLHSTFTADYEFSDKKFKIFIIECGDQNDCRDMIQKYLAKIGKAEKSVAEGRHTISDPHHGEIDLCWRGRHLWGILNINDPELRSKYLKLLEEGLEKKISSD